jgi:hypothetical protein
LDQLVAGPYHGLVALLKRSHVEEDPMRTRTQALLQALQRRLAALSLIW